MTIRNNDWMTGALCAQVDTEIFFPDKGQRVDDAKRICRACTVRRECADYATAEFHTGNDHGVWGDTAPRDRRALRNAS